MRPCGDHIPAPSLGQPCRCGDVALMDAATCVRATQVLEGDCDTQVSLLRGALDERDRSLKRLRADLDAAESAREAADTRCRAADAAAVEATAAADSAAARASSLHAAVEELQAVLARRADDGHRLHALLADAAAAQEVISALEAELGDARAAAARRAGDASVPGPDDGVVHGMQIASADEPGAASSDVSRGGCLESALGAEVEELRAENERLRGLLRDRGADLVSMRGEAAALQVRTRLPCPCGCSSLSRTCGASMAAV